MIPDEKFEEIERKENEIALLLNEVDKMKSNLSNPIYAYAKRMRTDRWDWEEPQLLHNNPTEDGDAEMSEDITVDCDGHGMVAVTFYYPREGISQPCKILGIPREYFQMSLSLVEKKEKELEKILLQKENDKERQQKFQLFKQLKEELGL